MKLSRLDLLHSLESVSPGLTPRDVTEQSSCFAFKAGNVFTFNDEIACQRKCPLDIEGAVQATPLLALLRKMPEDHIDCFVENGELIIKGKKRKSGIRVSDVTMATVELDEAVEWKQTHESFSDAIHIAAQCCGKDESNYTTTCVHVGKKYVEACDNHQAVRYRLRTRVDQDFLVRGASIKHIVSLNMTEFAESDTWVHFKNPTGLVLSCRRDVQDYESLDEILTVDGTKLTLPKGLIEAVETAEIFSSENVDDNEVSVCISAGRIKIVGNGTSGWYSETKKSNYSGDPITFLVAPKLLMDIVKKYSEAEITSERMKIQAEKFVYVVALGTTSKEETGSSDGDGTDESDEIPF